jgi:hypothetical protein
MTPPNSVHPLSRAEWRQWLAANHTRTEGIWLISYKKATGKPAVTYDESVEEALCFGWIDSKGNKLDDERSMLWFAPRKPRTGWSKPNKERVERLIQAGLMTPAGLAKIENAKADGSWSPWMGSRRWKSRRTWLRRWPPTLRRSRTLPPFPARPNGAFWSGFKTPSDQRPAPIALQRPSGWRQKIFGPISGANSLGQARPCLRCKGPGQLSADRLPTVFHVRCKQKRLIAQLQIDF